MQTLNDLNHAVNQYLNSKNVNVPFYIAGGSIFSTLNGNKHYNDIDVFFYNEIDYQIAVSCVDEIRHETINAVSFNPKAFPHLKFQFIKLHIGHPLEVFKTFDLNCAKCAYTHDGKLIKAEDYNVVIDANVESMNGLTLGRYFKYVNDKKALDPDNKTLYKILRHLIDNFKVKFGMSYEGVAPEYGFKVIEMYLGSFKSFKPIQYIHDYVASKDLKFRMNFFGNADALYNYRVENMCDEYRLFEIIKQMKSDSIFGHHREYDEEDKRVKLKYAEFFI